ncbi:hypothetical protein TR74_07045, partial [Carbonactinospora thermoautotrophica]
MKTTTHRRRVPRNRTGTPVRPSSPLRRVLRACGHGWIREGYARVGEWIWCDECADFARVI